MCKQQAFFEASQVLQFGEDHKDNVQGRILLLSIPRLRSVQMDAEECVTKDLQSQSIHLLEEEFQTGYLETITRENLLDHEGYAHYIRLA